MIVAIIPARSGSKGFVNKNIASIKGISLMERAIKKALDSKIIDYVYISTDSNEYEDIAIKSGALSLGLRPSNLSLDSTTTQEVIINFLENDKAKNVTHIVLLQPTSPIRTVDLVDRAISVSLDTNQSVVSVAKVEDPHPFKLKKIINNKLVPFIENTNSEINRQSLPLAYELTGSIYVTTKKNILERNSFFSESTIPIIQENFINIDSEKDFIFFKYLVENCLLNEDEI